MFGGIWLHARNQNVISAIFFALAIASRQYMIAFPPAIVIHEMLSSRSRAGRKSLAWIAPLLASASIVGGCVFFGGLAPPGELAHQQVATGSLLRVFPDHCLYFLTCVGLYYVLLEFMLLRRSLDIKSLRRPRNVIIACALLGTFIIFPPIQNPFDYPIRAMGLFDRETRHMLGGADTPRIALFYICALLACLRFNRFSLPALLVWANALLMVKAHIGLDKYAMPLLIALWFLAADQSRAEDPEGSSPSPDIKIKGMPQSEQHIKKVPDLPCRKAPRAG